MARPGFRLIALVWDLDRGPVGVVSRQPCAHEALGMLGSVRLAWHFSCTSTALAAPLSATSQSVLQPLVLRLRAYGWRPDSLLATCQGLVGYTQDKSISWAHVETPLDLSPPCSGVALITALREPWARMLTEFEERRWSSAWSPASAWAASAWGHFLDLVTNGRCFADPLLILRQVVLLKSH
mmetsp:Transcript_130018/g.415835  ORF Transcript_130018/g.415835 Transcript_130018/m.415835 type:complete len:182 (+) Transcript_130018:47-592(+)